MKKKTLMVILFAGLFAVLNQFNTFEDKAEVAEQMLDENVEALTNGEESGIYNICYSESKVKKGYTYYSCGDCKKVYDEKGKGSYSKCFY